MHRAAVVTSLLVLSLSCCSVNGSAIPMWEFLGRGEKMSHLFNMFVKQVQQYCDSLSMPDCNKVLLVYGLTNLAKMEDDSLDKMDPYQRGATDIIWNSMMKGTFKTPSDNMEPLDYSYASAAGPSAGNGNNNLGSQEEASTNVEQYLNPGPNKYVIGPMVVRVLPDGRPVPGDADRPLPKDEDAEEFRLMYSKPVPSVAELMGRRTFPGQQPASSAGRFLGQQQPGPSVGRYREQTPHAVYAAPPNHYRTPNL